MFGKRIKNKRLEWEKDLTAQKMVRYFSTTDHFKHVKSDRIFCYKTTGSKARAYARIWAFPKIFQDALDLEPAYVIECITEKFDRLSEEDKKKVIIHELLHIPKNFSGSLLPHKYGHKRIESEVKKIYNALKI